MTRGSRADVGTAVGFVAALAFVLLGMAAGPVVGIAVCVLLVLVSSLTIVRFDLKHLGVGSACGAAATLPWNGWILGPVHPGEFFILMAFGFLLAAQIHDDLPRLPWWVKQMSATILVVAILNELVPVDERYLQSRTVLSATGQAMVPIYSGLLSNLGTAFKFIFAIALIPFTFALAAVVERRAVRWLVLCYVAGSGISGFAALSDRIGIPVSGMLKGYSGATGGRQAGFALHPNFLAEACVLPIPLAIYLSLARDRVSRLVGTTSFLGLVAGVYVSGSRGGAVSLVVAIFVSVFVIPQARKFAPALVLGTGAVSTAVLAYMPSVWDEILRVTRLGGGLHTEGSDAVREALGAQGVRDFEFSPLRGIGLQVGTEASNVYLQLLASGGLLLFAGMMVYLLGAMYASWRLLPRSPLAGGLLGMIVPVISLNVVEASLTDRFYYVPQALVVALMADMALRGTSSENAVCALDVPAEPGRVRTSDAP